VKQDEKHPECACDSAVSATEQAPTEMLQSTPIVFVVDDDFSVRESLGPLICTEGLQPKMFGTAREFLAHPRVLVPNCLVLDFLLPDMNGLEVQKRIAFEREEMSVIFVSGCGDVPMTVRAMKAGALDFLTKPFNDDCLLRAIREGLECSREALLRDAEMRTLRACYASLSWREQQVMLLVVAGLSNRQVGSELAIAEGTVKTHRGRVMEKMMAESFVDLIRKAARLSHANLGDVEYQDNTGDPWGR